MDTQVKLTQVREATWSELMRNSQLVPLFVDGNLKGLVHPAEGWSIDADYAGLKVYVKRPPKEVEKWAVMGTVLGISVDEVYDSPEEAHDRVEELSHYPSSVHSERRTVLVE